MSANRKFRAAIALRKIPLFSTMNLADLKHLAGIARVHRVSPGSLIFQKNQAGNHLFVVIKGRIKIYSQLHDVKKKKTFAYLEPGDFFGEMSLLDKKGRSLSAAALAETELLTISRAEFQNLIACEPAFAFKVVKTLVERLRRANEEIEAFAFKSLYGRVCRKILELSQKRPPMRGRPPKASLAKGGEPSIAMTHRELADLTGTAREMVSKVLSSLGRLGVIVREDHRIKILSQAKLRELAQAEPR